MSTPYRPKPASLRALTLAARLFGRARVERVLGLLFASELMTGEQRRSNKRRLRRVFERVGRPATAETLEAAIRVLGGLYAEHITTLNLLDPDRPPPAPMELPRKALAQARAGGRGVILASPHFGNLSLAMVSLPQAGVPLTAVVINAQPYAWLSRLGVSAVDLGESALPVTRALAANEGVWINCDWEFFPDGRTVDFFGAPVTPPQGTARLSQATGAPILPVYPVKIDGRWRLEADALIEPRGKDPETLEKELLASMERFIGRYPDHWWIFVDPWDVEGTRQHLKKRLSRLHILRRVLSLLGLG